MGIKRRMEESIENAKAECSACGIILGFHKQCEICSQPICEKKDGVKFDSCWFCRDCLWEHATNTCPDDCDREDFVQGFMSAFDLIADPKEELQPDP